MDCQSFRLEGVWCDMNYLEEVNKWIAIDPESAGELEAIKDDPKELEDRFYKDLEFGTAGMRGVVGAGRNRLNRYNIERATQGFAAFLDARAREMSREKKVAIAHDPRRMSREFAEYTASVLAANGFTVYFYDGVRTTPQLSYTVRHLGCIGGVMITASHNPPEYNGYKVYDEEGCQLIPELADELVRLVYDVREIQRLPFADAVVEGRICWIGAEVDDTYLGMVRGLSFHPEYLSENALRIVYTPLHGAGGATIRRLFAESGVTNVRYVASQMEPDGGFPTVKKPNPEEASAFAEAKKVLDSENGDLVVATDPDTDRVAVMTKSGRLLTGNQLGVLFLDYVLSQRKERGWIREGDYIISTVVSTDMAETIARHYGVEYRETLTGFKHIGEVIQRDPEHFVMGFEESIGYLFSPEVRDKDAVMATMFVVEMAEHYRRTYGAERPLEAALDALYEKFGVHLEETVSIQFEGKDGAELMNQKMLQARNLVPTKGVRKIDYIDGRDGQRPTNMVRFYFGSDMQGVDTRGADTQGADTQGADALGADALGVETQGGDPLGSGAASSVVLRPSGTEPKLKLYYFARGRNQAEAEQRLQSLQEWLRMII